MERIEYLQKALDIWKDYVKDTPKFYPWISEDILFLIKIENRAINGEIPIQSEEDKEGLSDIAGDVTSMGPISGAAIHDVPDIEVGNILCDVQEIARQMKKEYIDNGS